MITQSILSRESVKVEHGATSYRIPAFDFTKGMLVLFMVLYHWLNYFYGSQGEIYKYLRFLTPSFIFITGFLISHVHFAKYGIGSSKLSARLSVRGIKLLIVFVALNIVVSLLMPSSFVRAISSSQATLANLNAIFITGDISNSEFGKIAAFAILAPISYLLILSSLLSILCRFFKYTFHVACVLSLFCMVFLDLRHIQSPNIELITIGLLGIVLGFGSGDELQRRMNHSWGLVAGYCIYLVVITIYDVSFYLQIIGACLTTAMIYLLGARTTTKDPSRLQSHIVLLGKYSLFGYISQIAILQCLRIGLKHVNNSSVVLSTSFVVGFALTMISVEAMDRGRARSKTIDSAYRTIFA